MDLVDTIPDVRYWSKFLWCSIPPPLEVKVTDFFMISEMSILMKCLYHISQSSESLHLSNIRTLENLFPFHNYWPQCTCHGVGAGGENIEHPYTLAILNWFFFCFNCILVLLARHSSGKLCCSATTLIDSRHYLVAGHFRIAVCLSSPKSLCMLSWILIS